MLKVEPLYLNRKTDSTGISGTGVVAVGARFPSGQVVLEWQTFTSSISIFRSLEHVIEVHGHGMDTEIIMGHPYINNIKIEWRKVPNYENYYISNIGQLKSNFNNKNKYLKPSYDQDGYIYYTLQKKKFKAHRLVLLAFKGEPSIENPICRHLDGNPTNNYITNLEWGSRSENELDKVLHGTSNRGEDSPKTKLSNNDVYEIRREFKKSGLSMRKFSKINHTKYNMSYSGFYKIISQKSFKYLKEEENESN